MPLLFAFGVIVFLILLAWVIGEVKNIRAFRIPAILVPLWLGPILAYQGGLVVGHGRAYVNTRDETLKFLSAVETNLERGETEQVLSEIRQLQRRGKTGHDKGAGSFFFSDMWYAVQHLSSDGQSH